MEERLIEKTNEYIKQMLDSDINTGNIEYLYKLKKINHMAKEDKEMYNDYNGRRPGYDSYGRYGEYGRMSYGMRGRDMKYRGEDELDRLHGEYGRYQDSYNRYGVGDETDKSFHYMIKSLEDFIRVLYEEAKTPQQSQELRETLQRCMM